jgi:hypothetical protein
MAKLLMVSLTAQLVEVLSTCPPTETSDCSGDLEEFPLTQGLSPWRIRRHQILKPQIPVGTTSLSARSAPELNVFFLYNLVILFNFLLFYFVTIRY